MTRIEQIRQRYVSRSQVRRLTVADAGRVHDDLIALLSAWGTRDAALRTLVEELRLPEGSLNVDHERNRVADALDAILKETTL